MKFLRGNRECEHCDNVKIVSGEPRHYECIHLLMKNIKRGNHDTVKELESKLAKITADRDELIEMVNEKNKRIKELESKQ